MEFRSRVGDSAVDLFRDRFRDVARGGRWSLFRFWGRTLANVAVHGMLERVAVLRERHPFRGIGTDVRSAVRTGRRSAKLNLAAVACIAMGIAATAAVLTLFTSVVLQPLPFPEASRLVRVWQQEEGVLRTGRGQLSYPDVTDIAGQLTTLDRFEATGRARLMFLGDRGARRVEGEAVTPGYFELLGVEPFLGRLFAADEYRAASGATMLLAYGTWMTDFGGDPDVLGATVRTNTLDYTVVGVLPPDFLGTIEEDFPDIEYWVPIEQYDMPARRDRRDVAYIWTIARIAPGASVEQAQREVEAVGRSVAEGVTDTDRPFGLRLERLGENWREQMRGRNYLLLTAAGLLLLVAASNVAGLLVARTLNRRREFAVRAALGAGRGRLVRQSVVETLVLTLVGSAIGVASAPWVLATFIQLAPSELPQYMRVSPDTWALGLTVSVIAVAALVAGLIPAVVSARVHPADVLHGGRGQTTARAERAWGRLLVAGEVALTTVLLVTAGLLMRSYRTLEITDVGFRTHNLLSMAVFLGVEDMPSLEQSPAFQGRIREAVSSYPGVEKVGLVWPTVPPGWGGDARIRFAGMPAEVEQHGLAIFAHVVDRDLLPALEIPVIAGRNITESDGRGSRLVTVVSASLAEQMGGVEQAVGRTLELEGSTYDIVGVARDVMFFGPARPRDRDMDIYLSLAQHPQRILSIAIQTSGDPAAYVEPLRARLAAIAPTSPLDWINPVNTSIATAFQGPRFYMLLLSAFASSALVLTAVGLFAVLANQVARQTAEFGIRQALGENQGSVVRGIVGDGLLVVAGGLAAGVVGGVVAGQALQTSLFGVGAFDWVTFLAAATVMVLVALAASAWPAWRAARVDPMEALRAE
jgi:predicted permease